MLTDNEKEGLNLLIKGERLPENGMETHFINVLNGKASPCTVKEKEWFEFWSHSKIEHHQHSQSIVELKKCVALDNVGDLTQPALIHKAPLEESDETTQSHGEEINDDAAQIDGGNIVRWAALASPDELSLLILAEYSDAEDIFIIRAVQHSGLTVTREGLPEEIIRPFNSFKAGVFFFSSNNGERINKLIYNALSPFDIRVMEASNYLLAHGFLVSELGGNSSLILADAIRNFDEREEVPDGDNWNDIHALLVDRPIATKKCAAKYISTWIRHIENMKSEGFDVYRRVLLAVLLRHSGQLDKSLEVSEVVNLPRRRLMGTNSSISVLCTVRAATLMDIAEVKPNKNADFLKQARLILNKANAMSGGDHVEILATYQRLGMLEKRI